MKTKNSGISLIIALGTSLLVLFIAFSTLDTIGKSLDQAYNIQRSTQSFFASESGIEAAFFHHNARGAGVVLDDTDQVITHENVNATNKWSVIGRTTDDTRTTVDSHPFYAGIIKENQAIQIPLKWDSSDEPSDVSLIYQIPRTGSNEIEVNFYKDTDASTITDNNTRNFITNEYGDVEVPSGFDFGDSGDNQILFDWSVSRKHNTNGIETFIPDGGSSGGDGNTDCGDGSSFVSGFICENQINTGNRVNFSTSSSFNINGTIRPTGTDDEDLNDFWSCAASTCSDYRLTIRPLLPFTDTNNVKIKGIPFSIVYSNAGTTASFPTPTYIVESDVTQEDFSQEIKITVREKTSIGAFDYVIFD